MKINPTGPHWAFVQNKNKIYYAHCELTEGKPFTPVTKLLQNFFDNYLDQSFFTLRNRIFCNYKPTALCTGMTKVVAKRISPLLEYSNLPLQNVANTFFNQNPSQEPLEFIKIEGPHSGPFLRDEQLALLPPNIEELLNQPVNSVKHILKLLEALSSSIPRGEILHDYHRPISALIVDPQNKILSYGIHSGAQNKTLHAEVNAIQKLFNNNQSRIPKGSTIYVSHKPCKMCAAMIWRMAEDIQTCRIFFKEIELGGLSKTTILDENSAERIQFSPTEQRNLKVQFQITDQ